jgi:hypothetical protein
LRDRLFDLYVRLAGRPCFARVLEEAQPYFEYIPGQGASGRSPNPPTRLRDERCQR